MMIFIGNIEAKADDKGRVFVPAVYRKQLNGDQTVVVRKDPDNKCLMVYPRSVWEAKVEMLKSGLNEWDPQDQMILMQFVSDAICLDVDAQGRILIPRKYLDEIGLKNDALFVGSVDRFALWAKDVFESSKMDAADFAKALREKMSAGKTSNNDQNV
ncbi:MAG: cell division/cell wall cluster transcriptional repressor MraZ [Paludibacteraceae bacterium]|nr:cell division/cell wall cluster transcriptional repressor MraZ [Paludibacteraceae bacterium]